MTMLSGIVWICRATGDLIQNIMVMVMFFIVMIMVIWMCHRDLVIVTMMVMIFRSMTVMVYLFIFDSARTAITTDTFLALTGAAIA